MFKFAAAALLATSALAFEHVQSKNNMATPWSFKKTHLIELSGFYTFDFGWKGKYDTSFPTETTIKDYLAYKDRKQAQLVLPS